MLTTPQPPSSTKQSWLSAAASCIRLVWEYCLKDVDDPMAEKKADALLVAASVIATMNYQAAMSPPGGAYQDTSHFANGTVAYEAGQAIAARIFSFLLTTSMFATITATTYSYKLAMEATTPDHAERKHAWKFVSRLVTGALVTWCVAAGIAMLVFLWMQLKSPLTSAYRRATRKP